MAIDPKAAAAAAQAAAEAARAAAEAAAAAAADSNTDAKMPTLAESTAQQALRDTEATGAGDDLLDGTSMASVVDLDLSSLGGTLGDVSGRASLLELPGLDSALGDRYGGLEGPTLKMPGSGGAGDVANWASVGISTSQTEQVFPTWEPGTDWVTGSAGMFTVDTHHPSGVRIHISTDGGTVTLVDTGNMHASAYSDGTRTDYVLDDADTWIKVGEYEMHSDDSAPLLTTGLSADEVTAWVNEFFGTDVIVVEEDESSAGSSGVARPAPDEYGGYTGDWQGITPIGPGSGDDDLVAGATGNTGSSGGGGLGPQGGSWAINPGAEGFVAGRETDLRDAKEWYGGVSQPGSPDLQENSGGDPQLLEQGIQVVDPETVNPSRNDADTADAGAQASTAYRTMAAPAGTVPASDVAADDGPTDLATDGAPADDAGASLDEPTVPGHGLPGMDDVDTTGGSGHGRGREFGQEQGQGRGRDDQERAEDLGE